jgi:hypothetical protein
MEESNNKKEEEEEKRGNNLWEKEEARKKEEEETKEENRKRESGSEHGCMIRGRLPKVSFGPAMPYPSTPCEQATLETGLQPFQGWPACRTPYDISLWGSVKGNRRKSSKMQKGN